MSNTKQYRPGDKVRFLNDVGGGEVRRVQKDGTLIVETEDGFEYPVAAEDLVLIERGAESLVQHTVDEAPQHTEPEKMKISEDRTVYKVLLAFTRDEDARNVSMFLINDSPYYLNFALYQAYDEAYKLISQDVLEPDIKLELMTIDDRDLNDMKKVAMQGLFTGNQMQQLKPAIQTELKIKPTRLIQDEAYSNSDYFHNKAQVHVMYSNDIVVNADLNAVFAEKEMQETLDAEKSRRSKKRPEPVVWEEDLHINELVDSVVGMSNHEILEYQMSYFHEVLNEAIKERIESVVFIHGIGNGTLKSTLRKSLENDYKLRYEDASFKEYGFGATRVFPTQQAKS
ncbi:MAG: DUF2027 domain-containing protein [Bacteroidota bacterium]|nr:DUF2027 domain-containing protein [Bacteroidota bacterium]